MPGRDTLNLDFASIVEDSLNEIYIFDESTLKFILINRGARENIGYSKEELRDLSPVDIKPEYTEAKFRKILSPLTSGAQEKINFQTIHRRKDRSTYPVDVHIQKRHLDGRNVFVAIILDTTERNRTNEELAFSQALIDSAPDAMVVVDETGKVFIANRQMERLLGYTREELVTMVVDDFVPTASRELHKQYRADYHRSPHARGMGPDLDLAAITKGGALIPVEISLSPVTNKNRNFVSAAIRDITARRKIEIAIKQSEEEQRLARRQAEDATRTKTRFLAAASHDLRQPLQALRLYLSSMTAYCDNATAQELSKKMHLSLDTMGELLESLLDLSALESGNIHAEIRNIRLRELTDRLIAANTPQTIDKKIEFTADIDDVAVKTDPALLERIIENFISNAIRYTKKGGVTIATHLIEDKVRLSVSDTGIGIPPEALDTVFDEYYQLDNKVRDRSKGLGLGLSIVKHVAKILGHQISAKSHQGGGSCFSVDIPLGELDAATISQQEFSIQLVHTSSPQHVLIIDDDAAIIDAMAGAMRTHNIAVSMADSGVEALKQVIRGLRPTLILSDYRMPQLDGLETVVALREELGADIPALIMTGDTSLNQVSKATLDNFDVLIKPIRQSTLMQLVTLVKGA